MARSSKLEIVKLHLAVLTKIRNWMRCRKWKFDISSRESESERISKHSQSPSSSIPCDKFRLKEKVQPIRQWLEVSAGKERKPHMWKRGPRARRKVKLLFESESEIRHSLAARLKLIRNSLFIFLWRNDIRKWKRHAMLEHMEKCEDETVPRYKSLAMIAHGENQPFDFFPETAFSIQGLTSRSNNPWDKQGF